MDLNFRRRKREREIAKEVAKHLLRLSAEDAANPEIIIRHCATVFERLGFAPDPSSAGRILDYANAEIIRTRRELERVVSQVESAMQAPAPDGLGHFDVPEHNFTGK